MPPALHTSSSCVLSASAVQFRMLHSRNVDSSINASSSGVFLPPAVRQIPGNQLVALGECSVDSAVDFVFKSACRLSALRDISACRSPFRSAAPDPAVAPRFLKRRRSCCASFRRVCFGDPFPAGHGFAQEHPQHFRRVVLLQESFTSSSASAGISGLAPYRPSNP